MIRGRLFLLFSFELRLRWSLTLLRGVRMLLPMIRAVLFDMDGTLGDTLPLCLEAFRRTIRDIDGRELGDEEISCYFGPSDRGVINRLLPDSEEKRERAYELFLRYYKELHPEMAPAPFPGVIEVLEMLEERGICLGVVTGKEPETAKITLEQFGLTRFFGSFIGTGSPEKVVKANRINHLCEIFNIRASEDVVYVGDVPADVKSSRIAGVVPVSAAWASTADVPALRAAVPAYLFVSISQLRLYLDRKTRPCIWNPKPWKSFWGYTLILLVMFFLALGFMSEILYPFSSKEILLILMLVTYFLIGLGLFKTMLGHR